MGVVAAAWLSAGRCEVGRRVALSWADGCGVGATEMQVALRFGVRFAAAGILR